MKLETFLAQLNTQELIKIMEEHLIKVIDEKENGKKSLFWNREFIETSVKKHFPEIYPQIIEQIEKDKQDTYFKVHEAVGLRYTPGSRTVSPEVVGRHWSGYALYTYGCRVSWSWNSTVITETQGSPYGRTHDPTWTFLGHTVDSEYPSNPTTYWNKYVEGEFGYPWPWHPQRNYAWLDIFVYPGGDWAYSSNPGN